MKYYAFPKVSALDLGSFGIAGPGLGNMLFPWARAYIFSKINSGQLIGPAWRQIKPKRLITLNGDLRNYGDYFNKSDYIYGLKKSLIRIVAIKINESDIQKTLPYTTRPIVIIFQGNNEMFTPLLAHRIDVRDELWKITNNKYKINYKERFKNSIAIHVRRGDFTKPSGLHELTTGGNNFQIPIEWFVFTLRHVRRTTKQNMKAYIYSDGVDSDLAPLLNESNTERIYSNNAISDLWSIANSYCLIASGSTFSMWGAFLGDMDSYWFPGQLKISSSFDNIHKNIEINPADH